MPACTLSDLKTSNSVLIYEATNFCSQFFYSLSGNTGNFHLATVWSFDWAEKLTLQPVLALMAIKACLQWHEQNLGIMQPVSIYKHCSFLQSHDRHLHVLQLHSNSGRVNRKTASHRHMRSYLRTVCVLLNNCSGL